jgi:aromatase
MSVSPFGSEGPVTAAEIEEILVSRTGLDAGAVADQPLASLEDLGLDSLAVLELQAEVARRYGVEIPETVLETNIIGLVSLINDNIEVTKSA